MTRPAQLLVGVLAFLALTAGAFAVGSATSYDDPPPTREIVVDEVASDPTPTARPTRQPSARPSPGDDRSGRGREDGRVEVVTPRPQQLDDDRGRGGGDDDDDDDERDDDGDDDGDDDD